MKTTNENIQRYDIARPLGHDHTLAAIESLILAAAAAGDHDVPLPHALIIAGPNGVGKFLAALWLSSRLKCAIPSTCVGDCPSCKKIRVGTHPDFYVIDPEPTDRSIGLSDIVGRIKPHMPAPKNPPGLIPRLSVHASEPGPLVAVLRDAHKMTLEAQSGLLKTLEEPPGAAFIVLVTDSLSSLLPTVRSRCQLLNLARLDQTTVEQILSARGIAPDQARAIASIADGSPGRALATSAESLEARNELLIDFELYRVGKSDMDALLKRLVDSKKDVDKPGLDTLYEWQMKKVEASLGYPRDEESDRLGGLLSRLQSGDSTGHGRLLREAEHVHTTMAALARNANPRLAIRDMLMAIRHA
jgi:DNA polymerase-3 subunit delta'